MFADERCATLSSAAIARHLNVSPELEREVVLLPLNPMEEDVKALAVALHADVAETGGKPRLFRRTATLKALVRDDRAALEKSIAAIVAHADDRARRYGESPADAPYTAMRDMRARFAAHPIGVDNGAMQVNEVVPGARLLADLLRRLPPKALDDAVPGRGTTYSNAPQGMEMLWPGGDDALARYVSDQGRFSTRTEEAARRGEIPKEYLWAFPQGGFPSGERTFQLFVSRNETEPVVALTVYDLSGRRESNALLTVHGFVRVGEPPKSLPASLGVIALPSETLGALARATPGGSEFRAESLDPVAHEPLDLLVRDALLLWARAKGYARTVACVPDSLFESVRDAVKDNVLDLDAVSRALEQADCESLVVGKALVVRPRQPLQEETLRVDRRPLAAMFQAASHGTLSFDELVAYHAAYTEEYGRCRPLQAMERPILQAFKLWQTPDWESPHELLATLGALSPPERAQVLGGGRASLAAPGYAPCLRVLARFANLYGLHPDAEEPQAKNRMVFRSAVATVSGSDLARTVSRILARVRAPWLEGSCEAPYTLVRRVTKDGKIVDRDFVSPSMFGADKPQFAKGLAQSYDFLWAEMRPLDLTVTLADGVKVGPHTISQRVRESKGPVPLDQVPGITPQKAADRGGNGFLKVIRNARDRGDSG